MNKALPRLVWILVAIVLLIGLIRLLVATRTHRSNDRQILIEKSK